MHVQEFVNGLNLKANELLRQAMTNERSKKWKKVVDNYRHLLEVLNSKHFPSGYRPPDGYGMLLYEVYYHLGGAQQHLGDHQAAVASYQKAIDSVFIRKNGCAAGCQSKSCLMTPLHTRRAFAFTKLGNLKNALSDAEKAVVLDARNPDAFCVRALVNNSFGNKREAVRDLTRALSLNSSHICALILRGCLVKPEEKHENVPEWSTKAENKDHNKAISISPDCQAFLNVESFYDPNIIKFYDRFLYSLNVPHNIVAINMNQDDDSQPKSGNETSTYKNSGKRRAFRCGTPTQHLTDAHARRMRYGESVRKHNARPQTAQQFLDLLTKQEKDRQKAELLSTRSRTSMSMTPSGRSRNESPAPLSRKISGTPSSTQIVIMPSSNTVSTDFSSGFQQRANGRRSQSTICTEIVTVSRSVPRQPKKDYGTMPVFQAVSLDAPRVYYRPWIGDKLPVPDVPPKQFSPPFY